MGEGFDLAVGFIERSYRSCTDDGHDERGEEKFDLCWHSENATMSFAGRNGELVKKSGNEWRLAPALLPVSGVLRSAPMFAIDRTWARILMPAMMVVRKGS